MTRDVGYYIEAPIQKVYQAYLDAATHEPFERDCKQEPYHMIAFGVNFSFKYNMNGGACHIRLMPSGSGTAVNMRFSIAQGMGARYERYAEDLNKAMQRFLPVTPRKMSYNADDFLNPRNQVTPDSLQPATPIPPVASLQPAAPVAQGTGAFCTNCGNPIAPGNRFCSQCGTAVSAGKHCTCCGTSVPENAVFCSNCGTRL